MATGRKVKENLKTTHIIEDTFKAIINTKKKKIEILVYHFLNFISFQFQEISFEII